MILYFDSYITDTPLIKKNEYKKKSTRKSSTNYKSCRKLDIAKYTLESYSLIPWTKVIIRYEVDNKSDYKELDSHVKKLFKKPIIIHKRSSTQNDYIESLKLLNKQKDNWIFYSPNNDHPIVYPGKDLNNYINKFLKLADTYESSNEFVSIIYSHFSEFINLPVRGNPEHARNGQDSQIIYENKDRLVYKSGKGEFSSIQIVNKKLINHWFSSKKLKNKRIIRAEDLKSEVCVEDQIIIVPKKEICAHFDSYLHMLGEINEIRSDQVPPLFIPPGYFNNKIKIAYGYKNYRKDWVNINPTSKKYVFDDSTTGTDLKISLQQIPFFWKSKVVKTEINRNVKRKEINVQVKKNYEKKINPWKLSTQGYNLKSVKFWYRYTTFLIKVRTRKSIRKFLNHD